MCILDFTIVNIAIPRSCFIFSNKKRLRDDINSRRTYRGGDRSGDRSSVPVPDGRNGNGTRGVVALRKGGQGGMKVR